MRKLSLFTLTAATVLTTAGAPLLAQASEGNYRYGRFQNGGYVVIQGTSGSELKEVLSRLETELGNGKWNICVPGLPATPEVSVPETPDTNTPDVNVPETPDTNTPDVNVPETPDSSTPEVSVPETPDSSTPGTNTPETGTPDINAPELTFAEQVVNLVNQERAKAGLKELILDKEIEAAALIRTREIQQSFSHTRPNGTKFSTVLKEQGISYQLAGENIAWGQVSPEAVMEAWMNSEGHRANILNPKFTKIGVGYEQNSAGRNYWTQLFTY